jgi:electron transport complex protein RnfD
MWAYQIFSGGALFAAVFMITDPVTSPTSKFGRLFYAVCAGAITALIRICGSYPEGAAFSILIMNMFTPCIDYFMRGKPNHYTWKQSILLCGSLILVCAIIVAYILVGGGR